MVHAEFVNLKGIDTLLSIHLIVYPPTFSTAPVTIISDFLVADTSLYTFESCNLFLFPEEDCELKHAKPIVGEL